MPCPAQDNLDPLLNSNIDQFFMEPILNKFKLYLSLGFTTVDFEKRD